MNLEIDFFFFEKIERIHMCNVFREGISNEKSND